MTPATCPTHDVDLIPTKSGMQFCCPLADCDFYTKESPMTKPAPSKSRTEIIAEAAAKKKAATTAPGVVTPAKPVPMKIPAPLNLTSGKKRTDNTTTVQERVPSNKRTKVTEQEVQAAADAEVDANVKPAKKPKDVNELTVSDVAKEVGIEPKVARQRLRKDGARAVDGRWPTVTRGSKEHADLVAKLKGGDDAKVAPDAKPAPKKKAPAKVEPEEEPDTEFEGEEEEEE